MINRTLAIIALLCLFSKQGIADDIKLGMSTVLSGDAAALGLDIKAGAESYFDYVNKQGGVQGRQLKLIVKDDGYEPSRAGENMRELIDSEQVVAVIGNVGTPTAIVTVPITNQKKTLLFGAVSGAEVLRADPPSRYVINYRASYVQETDALITGILASGIKPEEIAFFTQQDAFGNAGYMGAIASLKRHGFKETDNLWHVRYSRNSLNVESAVATLFNAAVRPKAIIMAGSYAPSARFIELIQQELPDTWFFNLSFVGSYALNTALADDVQHVVICQVVPDLSSSLPIIDEFRSRLKVYQPELEPNDVSLEGYIIAKLFHQGLLKVSGDITRESVIEGIERLDHVDIGLDIPLSFSAKNHQASNKLWMTTINQGKLVPFSWAKLNQAKKPK